MPYGNKRDAIQIGYLILSLLKDHPVGQISMDGLSARQISEPLELNFVRVRSRLEYMRQVGLVESVVVDGYHRRVWHYEITPKGREALKHHAALMRLYNLEE
ncbi:MAG: hypothetical protein HY361_04675 [Candidatus Aenigmarchaeota archaeon]|nr:hypothetical protein [Candidatus Aenigmarchaeota archaeon]